MNALRAVLCRLRDGARRVARGRPRPTPRGLVLGGLVGAVVALTVVPLVFLLWTSVWTGYPGQLSGSFTLDPFRSVYLEGAYPVLSLLGTSAIVAVGMTVTAGGFGLVFAWLFVRTNLPTRGAMELVLLTPYAVPGYVYAIVYATTYGPDHGLVPTVLQSTLGTSVVPLDVFSPWGIAFVVGVNYVTTVYLLAVPAIQDLDPALESAARVHGAGLVGTLRSVSGPLLLPAILSAVLVLLLRGLGEFSVVAILGARNGVDVYATAIYSAIRTSAPPEYGAAAALSLSLLAITVVLVWYYRRLTRHGASFATVTGRSARPERHDLGRWRWPLATLLWAVLLVVWLLPLGTMVVVSVHDTWLGHLDVGAFTVEHYAAAIGHGGLWHAFGNSVVVSVAAATVGTVLVVGLAYYTERTTYPFRGAVSVLSLAPLAIPGIILGGSLLAGVLWIDRLLPVVDLYGSLAIVVIGSVLVYIPFASRIAAGNILKIHPDLEAAARVAGASWLGQVRAVFAPLFRTTTVVLWFYLAIHVFQLLSIPLMTGTAATEVVPVTVYDIYMRDANVELVTAISTLFVGLMAVLLGLVRASGVRFYDLRRR